MKEFHGIIPPAITPLTAGRTLDVAGLERLVEHMISGGVHGIFVLGTTGEGPVLSGQVRRNMIRETVRIVRGRIPVLAGISSASWQDTAELAEYAKSCHVSAAVAAPPCYFKLGEPELEDFYRSLAAEIAMPLFIYNMPDMTKTTISPELVVKLADIPNICGYKDSTGNMIAFHKILLALKDRQDFSLFVGPEELLGESVLYGADGGVSGGANLLPEVFVAMYDAARKGDIAAMQKLQKVIYTNRKLYSIGHHQSSLIKGVKSALRQKGICKDYLAAPFNHFEEPESRIVGDILREVDALTGQK
ncbi:MAG: dihydrodipicolinate synthase family protein [Lentisphaeria bacterium]|nr:dihydrodipicolinate synthase family protein [Lentisphaeria bacterium]